MSEPAIRVDELAKSYGAQQVLRDVSLSIPAGQTCALLGRNGAGKTTTIRILLGLLPADSGTAHLAGINPAADPMNVRRQVGYLAEGRNAFLRHGPDRRIQRTSGTVVRRADANEADVLPVTTTGTLSERELSERMWGGLTQA